MVCIRAVEPSSWPKDNEIAPWKCSIYVLRELGYKNFKIGIARHPVRRLSTLQCGNPRKLEIICVYEGSRSTCKEVERIARQFFKIRKGTEWFFEDDHERIIEFLNSFASAEGAQ